MEELKPIDTWRERESAIRMSETAPWNAHRFIFVAGLHRSGTTLLADVIRSADGVSGLTKTGFPMDEGLFLQDVYPTRKHGGVSGGVSGWALDPKASVDERHGRLVPDAAKRLWASWSPYWDLKAELLVEKSPANLTKTRFLQHVFPNSSFVIITRHPVTQALSVRKGASIRSGRLTIGFPKLIEHWIHAHEVFREDSGYLNRLHVVRYEHLVHRPQREIRRLEEFLSLQIDPSVVGQVDVARSNVYQNQWDGVANRDWRAEVVAAFRRSGGKPWTALDDSARALLDGRLLPKYREDINMRFGESVRSLGYELDVLDDAAPWSSPLHSS